MSEGPDSKALTHQIWIDLCFEILLPILFAICLFFPLNFFIFNESHMFEKVFASSDLILLSALFLISTANQVHFETRFNGVETRVQYLYWPMLVGAILWFVLFGFCKYKYVNYSFPPPGSDVTIHIQISRIATWSIYSVVATSLTAVFFKVFFFTKKLGDQV